MLRITDIKEAPMESEAEREALLGWTTKTKVQVNNWISWSQQSGDFALFSRLRNILDSLEDIESFQNTGGQP